MSDRPQFTVDYEGENIVLYEPNPGTQEEFHASEAPNLLLSGPRGTGKSIALRMDAHMRALSKPGMMILILRRTMPELRKTHLVMIEREMRLMGGIYNKQEALATHYNDSKIFFGHCETDADVLKYLSTQWDAIYFDELTTFTLEQFLKICASVRTVVGRGVLAVVRAGTNPLGVGAGWVKRYFIKKDVPVTENEDYNPEDYQTLFMTRDENKHVDREQYDRRLSSLPAHIRAAWRDGEWVTEGIFFPEWAELDREGLPWHVIESLPKHNGRSVLAMPWVKIVASLDWGYSAAGNPGVCTWFALLHDDTAIAFDEYVFKETLPKDAAEEIAKRNSEFNMAYTVCDPSMFDAHTGESVAETFSRHKVSMIEGDNERVAGWMRLHAWLIETVDDGTGARPRLRYLRQGVHNGRVIGCPHAIRTMPTNVIDKNNPLDMESKHVEDDAADVARYFVMSRPAPSHEPPPNPNIKAVLDYVRNKKLKAGSMAGMR